MVGSSICQSVLSMTDRWERAQFPPGGNSLIAIWHVWWLPTSRETLACLKVMKEVIKWYKRKTKKVRLPRNSGTESWFRLKLLWLLLAEWGALQNTHIVLHFLSSYCGELKSSLHKLNSWIEHLRNHRNSLWKQTLVSLAVSSSDIFWLHCGICRTLRQTGV